MKNSFLAASIVLAIALIPSFASAATTDYNNAIGEEKHYVVQGTSATLTPSQGDAFIVSQTPVVGGFLDVLIKCRDTSSVRCMGVINH